MIIYGNTEHHKTERKENIPVEAQLSNINGLNTLIMPIKRHSLPKQIKKQNPNIYCLHKSSS